MPFDDGKKPGEDYSELIQALQQEERDAYDYLQSEVSVAQIDALRRYYGEKYGDEQEGRSQVVTREVFENIQWLLPALRRIFTAGGRIADFTGSTPESDQYADQAGDYINYVFFEDNDGDTLLGEFIFDGLLQRIGILGADWKQAEYSAPQDATGLNMLQYQQLMQDPRTEILEEDVRETPEGLLFDLKIRRVEKEAFAEIFTVAPEDIRISARSIDMATARYVGDVVRMMKGEAKQKWPDYADEIDGYSGHSTGVSDERRAERFRDLAGHDAEVRSTTDEAQEIEIMREFIRFDKDGDGYPEMVKCMRLGDCLLECEEVNDHIYEYWTPTPTPHKLYGLSVNDQCADIQRTKTVLLRSMLDSVYQSVVPRIAADEDSVNLSDLLTVAPGAVIRMKGNPGDKIMPVQVPDLSQSGITAMQWMDQVLEVRTGVTRHAQGLDPDALNHTAKGIQLMQNAANERKEQYASDVARGLKRFLRKLYRLVCANQNQARAVKIAGKWANIDPRLWESDVKVSIDTGLGAGSREAQLMFLQMLQADQAAAVQAWGINPCVTPDKMLNLVEEKMRVMGYRSREKFFGDAVNPDGSPWMPQPPPDPQAMKAQADAQVAQVKQQGEMMKLQAAVMKAQQDMQIAQLTQQVDMLQAQIAAAETQAREKNDAAKIQLDGAKAEAEVQLGWAKLEVEREKIAATREATSMKREEMASKENMDRERMEFEREGRDKEHKLRRWEKSQGDDKEDAAADMDGKKSRSDVLAEKMEEMMKEMRRPRTVKRDAQGRLSGVE